PNGGRTALSECDTITLRIQVAPLSLGAVQPLQYREAVKTKTLGNFLDRHKLRTYSHHIKQVASDITSYLGANPPPHSKAPPR
ncbi:hypothetical protein MRY87_09070, partial [bacterium]|nr:hypothetical protein [bacterium]